VQIYNDGYWPICGGKHPQSMGQDFTECWRRPGRSSARRSNVRWRGETSYLENQRMFPTATDTGRDLFTFSFSPIRDETGGVGGLFHPVTGNHEQDDQRTSHAPRCATVAARTAKSPFERRGLRTRGADPADYTFDLPFVLFTCRRQSEPGPTHGPDRNIA